LGTYNALLTILHMGSLTSGTQAAQGFRYPFTGSRCCMVLGKLVQ